MLVEGWICGKGGMRGQRGSAQPRPIGTDTEKCFLLDGLGRLHPWPAFSKDPSKVSSLANVNTVTQGDGGSALPAVTLGERDPMGSGSLLETQDMAALWFARGGQWQYFLWDRQCCNVITVLAGWWLGRQSRPCRAGCMCILTHLPLEHTG